MSHNGLSGIATRWKTSKWYQLQRLTIYLLLQNAYRCICWWSWCYRNYLLHWRSLNTSVTARGECPSVWWTSYRQLETSIVRIRLAVEAHMRMCLWRRTKLVSSVFIHGRSARVHWSFYRLLHILSTRKVFIDVMILYEEACFSNISRSSKLYWPYAKPKDMITYNIYIACLS